MNIQTYNLHTSTYTWHGQWHAFGLTIEELAKSMVTIKLNWPIHVHLRWKRRHSFKNHLDWSWQRSLGNNTPEGVQDRLEENKEYIHWKKNNANKKPNKWRIAQKEKTLRTAFESSNFAFGWKNMACYDPETHMAWWKMHSMLTPCSSQQSLLACSKQIGHENLACSTWQVISMLHEAL